MSCGKRFVGVSATERCSEDVLDDVNDILRLILGSATGVATLFLYIDIQGCFNVLTSPAIGILGLKRWR